MTKALFACFLSLLIACSASGENKRMQKNEYIPARYVVISEEITARTALLLSERHNMRLLGTGGGLARCVNILILCFQITGPVDEATLREILIDSVDTFLFALNADEELRPHLSHYPFSPKGVQIDIYVMDKDNRPTIYPHISVASVEGGVLVYRMTSDEDRYTYKSKIFENYSDAKKKLGEQ